MSVRAVRLTPAFLATIAVGVLCCHPVPDASDASDSEPGNNEAPDAATDGMTADAGESAPEESYRTMEGIVLYYPFRDWDADSIPDKGGFADNLDLTFDSGVSEEEGSACLSRGEQLRAETITVANERLLRREPFSFEIWVNSQDNGAGTLLEWGDLMLELHREDGPLSLRFADQSRGTSYDALAAFTSGMSQFVYSYDGSVLRLYVDGALSAGWQIDSEFGLPIAENSVLTIGDNLLNVCIGLVAAYDRALSPAEILRHRVIGSRPSVDEERNLGPGGWSMTWKKDWGAPGMWELNVRAERSDLNYEGLSLRPEQRSLHRFDFQTGGLQPSEAILRVVTLRVVEPGTLTLHRVLVDWDADEVTWTQRRSMEPWGGPGLTAPEDRSEAVATLDVDADNVIVLDVSSAVEEWAADPSSNHGVVYVARDGLDYYGVRASDEPPADRPFLGLLGTSAPSAGAPEVPSNLRATMVETERIAVTWSAEERDYPISFEVYRDGTLIAAPLDTRWVDDGGTTESSYAVMATDPWGRRSDVVDTAVE